MSVQVSQDQSMKTCIDATIVSCMSTDVDISMSTHATMNTELLL